MWGRQRARQPGEGISLARDGHHWYPHFLFAVSNLMRSNDQVLQLSCSYHDAQLVLYGLFWQL